MPSHNLFTLEDARGLRVETRDEDVPCVLEAPVQGLIPVMNPNQYAFIEGIDQDSLATAIDHFARSAFIPHYVLRADAPQVGWIPVFSYDPECAVIRIDDIQVVNDYYDEVMKQHVG